MNEDTIDHIKCKGSLSANVFTSLYSDLYFILDAYIIDDTLDPSF